MADDQQATNGARPTLSEIDQTLWAEAYEEALGRGAGPNVARVYANQKLLYVRHERDGAAIAGERDYAAYR